MQRRVEKTEHYTSYAWLALGGLVVLIERQ